MPETLPESLRLLAELAGEQPASPLRPDQGVALTRIAKRLGCSVSQLMREYTALGEACLGGVAGPGWVRLECDAGGHWRARLTEKGQMQCRN